MTASMHFVRFVLSGKVQYRRRRSVGRRYRTDGTPASRFAQYFACLSAGVIARSPSGPLPDDGAGSAASFASGAHRRASSASTAARWRSSGHGSVPAAMMPTCRCRVGRRPRPRTGWAAWATFCLVEVSPLTHSSVGSGEIVGAPGREGATDPSHSICVQLGVTSA